MVEPYFQSKSGGRFWIGKPGFLFEFPSKYTKRNLAKFSYFDEVFNYFRFTFTVWQNWKYLADAFCHVLDPQLEFGKQQEAKKATILQEAHTEVEFNRRLAVLTQRPQVPIHYWAYLLPYTQYCPENGITMPL